jgi:hypothetical protein
VCAPASLVDVQGEGHGRVTRAGPGTARRP